MKLTFYPQLHCRTMHIIQYSWLEVVTTLSLLLCAAFCYRAQARKQACIDVALHWLMLCTWLSFL